MKGTPTVVLGGPLQSKPTWLNTSWVFDHVGIFFWGSIDAAKITKHEIGPESNLEWIGPSFSKIITKESLLIL